MAITKNAARQEVICASVPFAYTDVTDDTYMAAVDVPAGAIVVGGGIAVTTLFNSATDDKFSIGHKVGSASADKTQYAALSADVTAAPTWIPIVPTGYKFTEAGSIGIVWNGSGTAPSAGAGRFVVQYIRDGRSAFSQN